MADVEAHLQDTTPAPLVIGIGGASGSGKTTLAREIAREFSGCHFPVDNYYRDLSHLPPAERELQNFDDPDLIESELLHDHIAHLRSRLPVEAPHYDFAQHIRKKDAVMPIAAPALLLVEGNFALHFAQLRTLYDFTVYVDAPDEVCYQRRLARDTAQRGRTEASVRRQYEETVRPMAKAYIWPSAKHADMIVDGTLAIDWMVELVRRQLRASGLLAGMSKHQ